MQRAEDDLDYLERHSGIKSFMSGNGNGASHLYATTWLKDKKWLLIVRQEKADAFKALRTAAYQILLISVIGGAVILAVAFYLTDRIVRRMEQMHREKGRLNQQLIGASRLAELGEMAAGFAHEINNPLQIIKNEHSLIEILAAEIRSGDPAKRSETFDELADSLNQIRLQISRCARITQAILKFGRQTEPVPQQIDLAEFIPEVVNMVAKKAAVQGIRLNQEVSPGISPVYGDPAQLQQVLLNLFNNAMDAIDQRHGAAGGELQIDARHSGNGTVEIRVRDNGGGIRKDDLKKVFSPFFTTKPVGKGTGLGLSVCYGIIDGMGGGMTVDSTEGVGTTFVIRLPISGQTPA